MSESLKVGDHVSYQGERRFGLRSWDCRKRVCPGDVGTVVEQLTDTRPWMTPASFWWKVDFGEGRVVTVTDYDLRIRQYRKEA